MKQFSDKEKENICQDYLINYNIQNSNKQVITILNSIYKDSNCDIELYRKRQKFQNFLLEQQMR